jgi:hypothetical protein
MQYDPGQTALQNDLRWVTGSGGIRQLGSGMIGGVYSTLDGGLTAEVSSIDASPKILAALGYDDSGPSFDLIGTGIDVDGALDIYNLWIADFTGSAFTARALGRNGHQFYEIVEAT